MFLNPLIIFKNFQTFNIYDRLGIKLLNRLRVDFNHRNVHNFSHKFADTLNPLCLCSLET